MALNWKFVDGISALQAKRDRMMMSASYILRKNITTDTIPLDESNPNWESYIKELQNIDEWFTTEVLRLRAVLKLTGGT